MRAVCVLVLLCCRLLEGQSVSVNSITQSHEDRQKEIQPENHRTEDPETTFIQHSCQPDIHSVLREMSAVLAELRVEQRHTSTAINHIDNRLRASESQVEELMKNNQAQAVNQSEMEARLGTELEELKIKYEEELKDLKTSFKITDNQVQNLKNENEERKVVFSASLGTEAGHTGPYNTEVTLVFNHVFTNIGNAYNPFTGVFTAPLRGVYQFKCFVIAEGKKAAYVAMHKNGHQILRLYGFQPQGYVSASNGVSLLLEVGDLVYLKLLANAWIYNDANHYSTFSGQMLFSF